MTDIEVKPASELYASELALDEIDKKYGKATFDKYLETIPVSVNQDKVLQAEKEWFEENVAKSRWLEKAKLAFTISTSFSPIISPIILFNIYLLIPYSFITYFLLLLLLDTIALISAIVSCEIDGFNRLVSAFESA